MKVRISELLRDMEAPDIEMEMSNMVSAEKIREMTMNKIKDNKTRARRVTKAYRIGLVAAILVVLFSIGAGAYRGFVEYGKSGGMLDSFFGERKVMSGDRVTEYETVEYGGETYEKLVTNIPAWERMPISEELMEKLASHIGAVEESISYGGYTLTVEACLYDANIGGGLLYYSVENPKGLEDYKIQTDGEIWWPTDSGWFAVVGEPEQSYIDEGRSTDTKLYICSHFAYVESWGDFEIRVGTGSDRTDKNSSGLSIDLYDTGMPCLSFAEGNVKLSYIGLAVDKTALGLPQSSDIDHIIIRFADGSEYIAVQDDEQAYISNLAYALDRGGDDGDGYDATYLFNSIVDIENVTEIQIEDMVFKVK